MAVDSEFEIQFFESILKKDPTYAEVVEILGGLYTQEGRLEDGLKMDRKLVKLLPESSTAHYNLGCSLALKNRQADAMKALRKAVELGYNDIEWMEEDPDLMFLHEYKPFQKLMDELRTGAEEN
tara:strand:+ start:5443 stop:5814 length:372 start_codon:yes stop_codon:yes gene_type:complete